MESRCDLSDAKYFNDNGVRWAFTFAKGPAWERHDCGVTALAISADIPYMLAHALLKSWGRRDRSYTPNLLKFIRKGPFRWSGGKIAPVTIDHFCRTRKSGRYLVMLRPRSFKCHLAAVVDGTFYNGAVDTLRCKIKYAWKLEGPRLKVL